MTLRNLAPRSIAIETTDGAATIPREGAAAWIPAVRWQEAAADAGGAEVAVARSIRRAPRGLPPPRAGVSLLVSRHVAEAAPDRSDLCFVHAGGRWLATRAAVPAPDAQLTAIEHAAADLLALASDGDAMPLDLITALHAAIARARARAAGSAAHDLAIAWRDLARATELTDEDELRRRVHAHPAFAALGDRADVQAAFLRWLASDAAAIVDGVAGTIGSLVLAGELVLEVEPDPGGCHHLHVRRAAPA